MYSNTASVKLRSDAYAGSVYAAQLALYQAYLRLTENPAIFTARSRDTPDIYHEPLPFDASLALCISDRGVQLPEASKALELPSR